MQTHSEVVAARSPARGFIIVLMILALAAGGMVATEQWRYVAALILLPLLWFWPIEGSLGLFALLLPFENLTLLRDNLTVVWVVGALAGCVLLAVGLSGQRFKFPPRPTLWWGVFLAWAVISMWWALDPATTIHLLPTSVALVALYFISACFAIREDEFDWIIRLAVIGGALAGAFACFQYFSGVAWTQIAAGSVVSRGSLIVGQTEVNPDSFGLKLMLPIALGIATFLGARKWWTRLLSFSALAITVFALLLTMSRAAFLALIVLVLFFVKRVRFDRKLLAVLGLACILLALMPAGFYLRLREAGASGGAGRLDIWKIALLGVQQHPVLGSGLGNFPVFYREYAGHGSRFMGFNRVAHNIYLNVWVEEGTIGLLLLAIAIVSQIKSTLHAAASSDRASLILLSCQAAFCSILVYGVFMDLIWDKAFWLSIMLLTFAIAVQSHSTTHSRALVQSARS